MSSDPKANFPKALRYYMDVNDKRQQDLIHDLKISSATLSQWVNGKMFPRMDKVEMLANYFKISVSDLLTNPYEKPKPSTNPLMMAKLIEGSPCLFELFTLSLSLSEDDINIIKVVANRLIQLQGNKPFEEL